MDKYDEITEAVLAQRLMEFGNAQFDCGAWEGESSENYNTVKNRADAIRADILTAVAAALRELGEQIRIHAASWPCGCAQNYPGSQNYHGQDCQNAVVQDFVADWLAGQARGGK